MTYEQVDAMLREMEDEATKAFQAANTLEGIFKYGAKRAALMEARLRLIKTLLSQEAVA